MGLKLQEKENVLKEFLKVPGSTPILANPLFKTLLSIQQRKLDPFCFDKRKIHRYLAVQYVNFLSEKKTLIKVVWSLKLPGTLHIAAPTQTIDKSLSSDVQYACLYWVFHLKKSRYQI